MALFFADFLALFFADFLVLAFLAGEAVADPASPVDFLATFLFGAAFLAGFFFEILFEPVAFLVLLTCFFAGAALAIINKSIINENQYKWKKKLANKAIYYLNQNHLLPRDNPGKKVNQDKAEKLSQIIN